MPSFGCGLRLVDPTVGFMKSNCKWVEKKPRPKTTKNKADQKIKKIVLTLDAAHMDFIGMQAIKKSKEDGKFISMGIFIREALEKIFPIPKQADILDDVK